MKLFKTLFAKDEELSIEDKEKINTLIEKKNYDNDSDKIDLIEFVSHLNLEQINELRDLLEIREDELHELYGLKNEKASDKREYKGEVNIEGPVHEEDLNEQTYFDDNKGYNQADEIDNSSIKEADVNEDEPEFKNFKEKAFEDEEEYVELDEDMKLEELEEKNFKDDLENTEDDIYLKIVKIFQEENVFRKVKKNINSKLPPNKDILCIGIRKSDAFNKDSDATQNSWFIQNIKQLDELAHFKMLTSLPNQKELFWDNKITPVLIVYKSTNILKTKDEFDF